ncbi:MAG: PAS domain S-box protein [Ignavibacteriae bacterium]|nr:PAS domain S-box protein [Ignavibacteriota bacterium]
MPGKVPFDRVGLGMLAVFTLFVLGSVVAGMLYAEWLTENTEHNARTQLTIIAEQKEQQIRGWYEERLGDARFLSRNTKGRESLAEGNVNKLQRFITHDVHPIVMPMFANGHYSHIILFDTLGRTLFSTSPHRGIASRRTRSDLVRVARRGEIAFGEHRYDSLGRTRIVLFVPLYMDEKIDRRWVGSYAMVIDPAKELLPIVRFWPVPSNTAQCSIAETRNNDSAFVITATSSENRPSETVYSLRDTTNPVVRAATGARGIMRGLDTYGEPVMAALTPVHGTAWTLAASVSEGEIFGDLQRQKIMIYIHVLGLVISAGAMLLFFFARQKAQFYQAQLNDERERQALRLHYENLIKHANDAMWLVDTDMNIVEFNDKALAMYGYSESEMRNMNLRAIRAPRTHEQLLRDVRQTLDHDGAIFETVHLTKSGTEIPVEVSTRRITSGDRMFLQGIIRDITERKRAELRIAQLNRLYTVLSSINRLVVRAVDEQEIFNETARILVEEGGFAISMISLRDATTNTAHRVASHGFRQVLERAAPITIEVGTTAMGPTGVALREGRTVVSVIDVEDPHLQVWREHIVATGVRSAAALPLIIDGEVAGAISIYSTERQFFDEQELALLRDLTSDISLALQARKLEKQRLRSEDALRHAEERLRLALRATKQGMFDVDMRTGEAFVSDEYVRMLGHDPATFVYSIDEWRILIHPEDSRHVLSVFEACASGAKQEYSMEYRLRTASGAYIWLLSMGAVVPDEEGGRPWRLIGTHIDITARIESERALFVAEERLRLALRASNQGLYDLNVQTGDAVVNEEYAKMLGYDPSTFRETNDAWIDRLHPDDREVCATTYRAYIAGEIPEYRVEFRQRMASGDWKWILSLGAIVERDAQGAPLRMLGTHTDIDAQRRAEEELRASRQRFQLFMDHLPGFAYIKDADGRHVFVSRSFADLFHTPITSMLNKTNREMYPPDAAAEFDVNDAKMFQTHLPMIAEESMTLDGQKRIFQSYKFPIPHPGGGMMLGGISMDVTAQRVLERDREHFFAMTEDLLCVADFDNRLRLVNKAWELLTGRPMSHIVGTRFSELVHEDDLDSTLGAMQNLGAGQTVRGFINRYRTRDGKFRWLSWNAVPLVDEALVFAVARDVTDQKEAAERLQEYNEQLRTLSTRLAETEEAERRALSRELHDDVGQNLTGLLLNLNIVRNQLLPDSLERVGKRLEESLRLVEETVDKTRNIMTALRPSMLDDYGLETALSWYAGVMSQRIGIPVEFVADTSAHPGRVDSGLETAFFRIAQEALHNVMKHARASHARLHLTIDASTCTLVISDDGIGFSAETPPRPNDRSGWGLITMRERIESYGGRFQLRSALEAGTSIIVAAPLQLQL